jgi:hypothetical protein
MLPPDSGDILSKGCKIPEVFFKGKLHFQSNQLWLPVTGSRLLVSGSASSKKQEASCQPNL